MKLVRVGNLVIQNGLQPGNIEDYFFFFNAGEKETGFLLVVTSTVLINCLTECFQNTTLSSGRRSGSFPTVPF